MLSIQEICQATGKSEKTIYRMMNDGKLPYKTISNKRYVAISDIDSHFKIQTRTNTEADLSKKIDMLTSEIARLSTLVESLVTNPPSPLRINSQQELTDKDCQEGINDSQSQSFNLDKIKSEITKKTPSSSNEIRAKKSKMQLFEALDKLKKSQNLPMYRGKPSITGVYKITGIDRGTISKYIEEWIDNNQD
ncbi:helix-turn-helix domain-containing protein [Vibrio crassostreae]|uniref:helix-turn-helix domain-containing protein n=1 Tax=Vibrio crassostreae TaxID=246167 RepID=UPI001B30FFC8|nr:helix-turn-helix domain-containing protein [Vibrio crassostreae]